jgi:hypothetical protein
MELAWQHFNLQQSGGKDLAAFGATSFENESATLRCHSRAETVSSFAFDDAGLECSLHGNDRRPGSRSGDSNEVVPVSQFTNDRNCGLQGIEFAATLIVKLIVKKILIYKCLLLLLLLRGTHRCASRI